MALYDKPVRVLMRDMVSDLVLKKGEVLTRDRVLGWFSEHYPKVKQGTIGAHLIQLSTNAKSRHHYSPKPEEDDLFYQIDGGRFRLYEPESDPAPIYVKIDDGARPPQDEEPPSQFAYEADLRNYLAKNLGLLEPGLALYEEEGIKGIEFPAGGRFIDILALDSKNNYVVIELKVSRGYGRVVGQLLRYMGWVSKNQAEENQSVRGFVVAREMSEDLKLACAGVPGVSLFEYALSVEVRRIDT